MTCEMMRERLLDAELDELAGYGSSPVAAHLRDCARCRAVAEQLLGDTRRLAKAIGAGETQAVTAPHMRARRRASRGSYLLVGALAAAALALVIVRQGVLDNTRPLAPSAADASKLAAHASATVATPGAARPAVPSTDASSASHARPSSHVAPPPDVPPRRVASRAPAPARAGQTSRPVPASLRRPMQPRPFPAARAVAPTPIAPSPASHALVVADARPLVAVTPADGKRAAVMRTRDPNITVVWFY